MKTTVNRDELCVISTGAAPAPSPRWISFHLIFDTGKTKTWDVMTKEEHAILGEIRWFGRWRGYAFFPLTDTVFEKTCLRDIANFIEEQNNLHRCRKDEGTKVKC